MDIPSPWSGPCRRTNWGHIFLFPWGFFLFLFLGGGGRFRVAPAAYGSSQARG